MICRFNTWFATSNLSFEFWIKQSLTSLVFHGIRFEERYSGPVNWMRNPRGLDSNSLSATYQVTTAVLKDQTHRERVKRWIPDTGVRMMGLLAKRKEFQLDIKNKAFFHSMWEKPYTIPHNFALLLLFEKFWKSRKFQDQFYFKLYIWCGYKFKCP